MSPVISGGGSGGGAISGVTVTGTAASGQVPVASSASAGAWAYPPGFEIGYDQITASVTVSATTESAGTTVISCAAHTFDGAAVVLEVFAPNISIAAADLCSFLLFEGATEIGRISDNRAAASSGAGGGGGTIGKLRFTPTAASHTYTITAIRGSANATVTAGLGGTGLYVAAYARFTKV